MNMLVSDSATDTVFFSRNQVEIKNIDKINFFTHLCRMNKNQVILVFDKDRQIDFFFQRRHLIINML